MIHVHPMLQRVLRRLRRTWGRSGAGKPARAESCTVAVVLPLEGQAGRWMVQQQIDLLRRIGRHPGLGAAPHLTLKMGFKTREPEVLQAWLDRLGADTPPLDIQLGGVDRFPEGVLFLDVVESAPLQALRRRVLHELASEFGVQPGSVEDEGFRFHATLTFDLPPALLDGEQLRLSALAPQFIESVSALELWLDVGSHWAKLHRTPMGGCAAADFRS